MYDPCFGYGGLLVGAARRQRAAARVSSPPWRGRQFSISGSEINPIAYAVGLCRLLLAGIDRPRLANHDTLDPERPLPRNRSADGFDCILAAPPWGRAGTDCYRDRFPFPSRHWETLFLQHVMNGLRAGGRAVVALPEGPLFRTGSDRRVRESLLSDYRVDGVVSLPGGAFEPCTSIPMSLVVFSRRKPPATVRFTSVSPTAWETAAPDGDYDQGDGQGEEDRLANRGHVRPNGSGFGSWPVTGAGFADASGLGSGRFSCSEFLRDIGELIGRRRELSVGPTSPGVETWEIAVPELALRDHELVAKKSGSEMLDAELERLDAANRSLRVVRLERVAEVYGGLSHKPGARTERRAAPDVVAGLLYPGDVTDVGMRPPFWFLTSEGMARVQERDFLRSGDLVVTTARHRRQDRLHHG